MARIKKQKSSQRRKGVSPVLAGLAGAAIGAAAAVVLSNKKTRNKVGATLKSTFNKGRKVARKTLRSI